MDPFQLFINVTQFGGWLSFLTFCTALCDMCDKCLFYYYKDKIAFCTPKRRRDPMTFGSSPMVLSAIITLGQSWILLHST